MIREIKSTQREDTLEIRWALTNVCNFKCRYCFPGSNEGNYQSPADLNLAINNFSYMLDCYKRDLGKTKFHLKILGGEPTVWKYLSEFINGVKQKHNVYVSIVSNGSRTLRWWEENGHLIDNLILSYHYEIADLNHTINVADIMYSLGKKVTVHAIMDDKHWDECVSSIQIMKRQSKYKWMIQTKELVSTPNNLVSYTPEQRIFLQKELKRFPTIIWLIKNIKLVLDGTVKKYESIFYTDNGKTGRASSQFYITTEQNKFKDWDCNIGIESVYINYTGDLMGSCGQIILGNSFNIFTNDFIREFKIKKTPVRCKLEKCICPPDTHVSKVITFY